MDLHPLDVATRLGLAVFLGGALGWQQQRLRKAVGIRTLMLVALGAAIFVATGDEFGKSRVGCAIVSPIVTGLIVGVALLGAAVIFRIEGREGVTAATAIWVAAGLGFACGLGEAIFAFSCYLLALLALSALRLAERRRLLEPPDLQYRQHPFSHAIRKPVVRKS